MKVYCFGNELIEEDSLAKNIADDLVIPGIEFVKCNSISDIFLEQDVIYILDVVQNFKEVALIEDVDDLKEHDIVSLHDFDLGFFLKLMNGIGQLNKVRIIGLPMKGDLNKIKEDVIKQLRALNISD